MSDKKKKSFLFRLYEKHMQEKAMTEEAQKPDEPDDSIDQPEVAKAAVEEEEDSAAAGFPRLKDILLSDTDIKKYYLYPMASLYFQRFTSQDHNLDIEDIDSLSDWILAPIMALPFYPSYEKELKGILADLCQEANTLLPLPPAETDPSSIGTIYPPRPEEVPINTEDASKDTDPCGPEQSSKDAYGRILMTKDLLYAFLFVFPPTPEGKPWQPDSLSILVQKAGITFGVDLSAIDPLPTADLYMRLLPLAQGVPPIDGKDGHILDLTQSQMPHSIQQDERGHADYKNLHLVSSVEAEQVLCEIIYPDEGIPGMDIFGNIINPKTGLEPSIPQGKNTHLSKDGTQLLAGLSGQVVFRDGQYSVEPVLIIRGNVDYSTGNIDFKGDVIIKGDVNNGFVVKAGRNLTIEGTVEGAFITAEGDVTIQKGMNGNLGGSIEAGGILKVSFLENTNARATGPVYVDTVINSYVASGDSIYIEGRKGVAIGGTLTAANAIEAKIIGSQSRREINIVIGEQAQVVEKRIALQEQLDKTIDTLDKLKKNLNYLSQMRDKLTPDKLTLLNQISEQYQAYTQKKRGMEKDLDNLIARESDYEQCYLKANTFYPPAKIKIGSISTFLEDTATRCKASLVDGEMHMGTY